jgi:DMSO/TMAO reductase YedYZ molybdopterin-dependent catalytic subunit
MKKGKVAPRSAFHTVTGLLALLALVALAVACGAAPAATPSTKSGGTPVAGGGEQAKPAEPTRVVEPTKAPEPTKEAFAAKPVAATSGCVECHTSSEKIKETAAPPAPVVKSAEQSGEG